MYLICTKKHQIEAHNIGIYIANIESPKNFFDNANKNWIPIVLSELTSSHHNGLSI